MAFIFNFQILLKNHFLSIIFLLITQTQFSHCQINDGFESGIVESEGTTFIDINDYHNLNLVISTSKKIYRQIKLQQVCQLSANIINYSKAATCNEKYILVACLGDSLLTKIKIDTCESTNLLGYNDINIDGDTNIMPDSICSISIFGNIVHIGISQNNSDKVQNYIIQLNMINLNDVDNGPDIDTSIEKSYFKFPEVIDKSDSIRQIICEVLVKQNDEGDRLICFYDKLVSGKHIIYGNSIKNDFSGFENKGEVKLYSFNSSPGFQIYRINPKTIKCIMKKNSYLITLKNDGIIKSGKDPFTPGDGDLDLYYYNNNFIIFSSSESTVKANKKKTYFIQINSELSDSDYYKIYDFEVKNDISIVKLLGYYFESDNAFLCVYRCSNNKIKYFVLHDIKDIFQIKSSNKIIQIVSNENSNSDISDVIQSDKNFGYLGIYKSTIITSTKSKTDYNYGTKTVEEDYFPIYSNILTAPKSQNTWYEYSLGFIDDNNDYLRIFFLPNANVTVQTCAFQCYSCTSEFSLCDSCRDSNYAQLNGAPDDNNCYPVTQRMKGYIYDKAYRSFEKCYSSCDFCSKKGSESSSSEHNCEACAEGYYSSYEHIGNCYKINEGDDISKDKYISQTEDEAFTSISSCSSISKSYKNVLTGECLSECPSISKYKLFEYKYVDFTVQTNANSENQYTASDEPPPKYKYNNLCYKECPTLTIADDSTNICKCLYAWHLDSDSKTICHEGNYCISNEHKYYLEDTKQCLDNGCPDGYFQFNFNCYKDGCPQNTSLSSIEPKKCESSYDFCYINEYFQTICSETHNDEYKYQFDNTVQYLKSCDESITYTTGGQKSYLYNGICYLTCLDITDKDETNSRCNCKYFGYYKEDTDNNYICFTEEEKCNNLIPVIDLKKCLNTTDDCISKGYKIFNNECYNSCPDKTKLSEDGINCICSNYFFDENNVLNCFESTETCETKSYPYSNPETYECFNDLEDCLSKSNLFYFNKNCYKSQCPSDKISLSSITNQTIKNNLIEELSVSNDLINKICICDIINTNINWEVNLDNDLSFQTCVDSCVEDYEPDPITRQCVEKCKPEKHFVFNNICYKKGCPSGSKLNESEPDSRVCVCEKTTYFDDENNVIICCDEDEGNCPNSKITYPQEYIDNPNKCPTVYNGECYLSCPENTCLTQKDENLVTCVPIKENMKVLNGICFENLESLIQSINNNINNNQSNNGVQQISTTKDTVISGYFATEETYEESKDSNYSLLYLNDCENLLKQEYHLPDNSKLFILQIESKNKQKKSAVNSFSYGIFLENGTQLNDLSACDGVKMKLSSPIIDPVSVHLDQANYFANLDYDIYDKESDFYKSNCAPASIEGNDITLSDRKTDFYPNDVSICNDSCTYSKVDLNSKRFECDCDINPSSNNNEEKEIIDETNYFDYLLSFINYKIIECSNLGFNKNNFKNNVGTYLGIITLVACFAIMVVFLTVGMNLINKKIFEGTPTKTKLEERIKEQEKKRQEMLKQIRENNKDMIEDEDEIGNENEIESPEIPATPPKRKEEKLNSKISSKNNDNIEFNKLNKGKNDIVVHIMGKRSIRNTTRRVNNNKDNSFENNNDIKVENYNDNTIEENNENNEKLSKNENKIIDINLEKDSQKNDLFQISKMSVNSSYSKNKKNSNRNKVRNKRRNTMYYDVVIDSHYLQTDKVDLNVKDEDYYKDLILNAKEVDKKEINNIPYTQALRIDNRSFVQIFASILFHKIECINIIYYRNDIVHLSLPISIYITSLLMDLTLNCLLYTDDEISEKYHNDGKLKFITSFTLSLFSNIISAIIIYIVSKLTEFSAVLELIIRDVSDQNNYYSNIVKFKKYFKLKISFFFIIQFILNFLMFYYMSVFCAVYNKTQGSILINYLYGILESLIFSIGIALVISIIRFLSIKYKWKSIYNASKYFYDNF